VVTLKAKLRISTTGRPTELVSESTSVNTLLSGRQEENEYFSICCRYCDAALRKDSWIIILTTTKEYDKDDESSEEGLIPLDGSYDNLDTTPATPQMPLLNSRKSLDVSRCGIN